MGLIEEFSTMVSEADPVVANEVANLFPDYPEKMTQQRWNNFRTWVNSEMDEPIRSICLPWCEEMRQVHLNVRMIVERPDDVTEILLYITMDVAHIPIVSSESEFDIELSKFLRLMGSSFKGRVKSLVGLAIELSYKSKVPVLALWSRNQYSW
ncbi:hypothetical protein FRX31_012413 [Thalictrum thalictroides]|uniref:Uncharacterized protein n=1 Tax=Thalictrum thalictroides TaxID=46969 RepID=A0A7J6WN27_THATH|nr:hypothetical protein FRX31_012413 [Thalictrum thalictroides]